eukprot:1707346-Prorocentrum_lima.AAC.1
MTRKERGPARPAHRGPRRTGAIRAAAKSRHQFRATRRALRRRQRSGEKPRPGAGFQHHHID